MKKVNGITIPDYYFEHINYFAFEGSSVTVLGLISYNQRSGSFEMTDLTALVAGGVKECKDYLKE